MAFWGIELKPTQSFTHHFDKERGRLHISQATLGWGGSTKKSVVQCNIGNKSPVLLCSLLPEKVECCPLDLEFEEAEEVTFSIVGPRSVHLTGYYLHTSTRHFVNKDSESESYGEDIGESDTEHSSDYIDDEYEDDFIDDGDPEIFPSSLIPHEVKEASGEQKSEKYNSGRKRLRKKYQVSDSDGNGASSPERVIKDNGMILGSEDEEDNLPISSLNGSKNSKITEAEKMSDSKTAEILMESNKKTVDDGDQVACAGRKNETHTNQDLDPILKNVGKKKKKKEKGKEGIVQVEADLLPKKADVKDYEDQVKVVNDKIEEVLGSTVVEHNGKLKKRKKDRLEDSITVRTGVEILGDQEPNVKLSVERLDVDSELIAAKKKKKKKKKKRSKNNEIEQHVEASKERALSNELVVEDLLMGQPDSKIASHGNKVAILYNGMLKANGHVFDSNVGGKPYKFRLGKAQEKQDGSCDPVKLCLEAAVKDMRVGGKRRLHIPPSMGYGSEGKGEIPGNSWLQYDVELINVK
ncbi:peptidyl-prolyl cis-trans isomerase FKBP43-like isoform X2 [Aristolochia californica]|uniref:peptidyl-prolyl cis-trans isomerase FKBP43-like isoform X2 n=1 Tax=Aristolochia californica TaxID=171875 RepID=UPI0035DD481C